MNTKIKSEEFWIKMLTLISVVSIVIQAVSACLSGTENGVTLNCGGLKEGQCHRFLLH